MPGMTTSTKSTRSRSTGSSSRSRSRSSSSSRDVPATADMTPPPVKPDPEPEPDSGAAESPPVPPGEPVGAGLLSRQDVTLPGVEQQQAERAVLGMVRRVGDKQLFDAATGQAPDPDGMFATVGHSGTVFECRVRLMERVWVSDKSTMERLVIPAGRQVSGPAARQIMAVVRAQNLAG